MFEKQEYAGRGEFNDGRDNSTIAVEQAAPKQYLADLMSGVSVGFTGDLTAVRNRLIKEYSETPAEEIDMAIKNYRIFLEVCRQNVGGYIVPNIFGVDEVWHAHILHLEQYVEDCYHFFGYLLYHRPLNTAKQPCCSADHCSKFISGKFFVKKTQIEKIH